ncbi:uncharacterized protein LOC125434801 [Sphaerodactylus townsendi]|uniref:uncharacterized protein LOC125434801 n=1 Tax=Sphaerodactylus townsendi TaxID=933632 RepID=UPI002025F7BC|nr:uncharacterized protein LOC125434801 [Sphaerodactylus townsendi]
MSAFASLEGRQRQRFAAPCSHPRGRTETAGEGNEEPKAVQPGNGGHTGKTHLTHLTHPPNLTHLIHLTQPNPTPPNPTPPNLTPPNLTHLTAWLTGGRVSVELRERTQKQLKSELKVHLELFQKVPQASEAPGHKWRPNKKRWKGLGGPRESDLKMATAGKTGCKSESAQPTLKQTGQKMEFKCILKDIKETPGEGERPWGRRQGNPRGDPQEGDGDAGEGRRARDKEPGGKNPKRSVSKRSAETKRGFKRTEG